MPSQQSCRGNHTKPLQQTQIVAIAPMFGHTTIHHAKDIDAGDLAASSGGWDAEKNAAMRATSVKPLDYTIAGSDDIVRYRIKIGKGGAKDLYPCFDTCRTGRC